MPFILQEPTRAQEDNSNYVDKKGGKSIVKELLISTYMVINTHKKEFYISGNSLERVTLKTGTLNILNGL